MKITFVSYAGERRTVDILGGLSLVEAALNNGITGIDAECGGACSCATCHVLIDLEWLGRVPPPTGIERDMLRELALRQFNSRLACQIKISETLEGMVVATPKSQG